ncbi:outer membrane beta-barrel protein [Yeosuana marina]|uniref:outer membrane beta-barrel protein n=1 Tax=Yeosuana marina TaxID=1565536 RepID=UPI0030EE7C4C|tara:strand:+ start:4030 stop:4596 length:567 start_codon:yes stop_codon:yes gene_type:complete
MKKNLTLFVVILLLSNVAKAQFVKEKSINVQIGFGMSAPYYSADDIADSGFYLQGEYVLGIASWVELRPYAGFIVTNSNGKDLHDNPTNEKSEAKAFLIGGKARVRAPIPWVAPYVEIGIGASVGKFDTFTAFTNINKSGLIYHIPFSIGVELGRHNNVDFGFTYYFQPTVEQFTGAIAVGISIPLKN